MISKFIVVGGGVGGVGKSSVTFGVVDTALEKKMQVLLIDSDTSNPDCFKAYKDIVKSEAIDLDKKEGWIELLNALNQNDGIAVLNTGARNNKGIASFGSLLMTALPELKCELETLWVIGRKKDSLEVLADYMETIHAGKIHVVRNLYHGESEKFTRFNESELKKKIEKAGGKTIDFPDLADRVVDEINHKRLALSEAATNLDFGDRIELSRYRREVWLALGDVV